MYCLATCQTMLYGNRKRTVERERSNTVIMLFRILGSAGVGLASCLYEGTNRINWLGTFRAYNGVWALTTGLGFYVLGRSRNEIDLSSDVDVVKNSNDGPPQNSNKFFTFAFQTLRRNSMRAVAILYALQGYISALSTNFLCLFMMVVCAKKPSSPLSSLLQALSFAAPHGLSALIVRLYGRYGKKKTVSVILLLRWILGFLLLLLSVQMMRNARGDGGIDARNLNRVEQRATTTATIHGYGIAFAILFFTHRTLTEITTDLHSAVLADVTDEDTVIFGRNDSMSAAIQHLISIPSKLLHSLAIIFTCIYLNTIDAIPLDVPHITESSRKDINVAAKVVWFIGINILLVSTLMLAVWVKWYDLSDKYLAFVQTAMRKRVEKAMIGVV
ncbi:unnamed protein product [Phytomonas sp. EM1]|nr:unnamed protein product [Phytomonas sp. EM1]|eukprot:CCW59540.1 unnamed protein product [Phytomonas sp. isolate EM1]